MNRFQWKHTRDIYKNTFYGKKKNNFHEYSRELLYEYYSKLIWREFVRYAYMRISKNRPESWLLANNTPKLSVLEPHLVHKKIVISLHRGDHSLCQGSVKFFICSLMLEEMFVQNAPFLDLKAKKISTRNVCRKPEIRM